MKVVLFGASGTIGKAVKAELSKRHEIISVGKKSGDYHCDVTKINQIEELFKKIGKVDAIISTAGSVPFLPFAEMTHEHYQQGLNDKLMGQVNLVLVGRNYLNENGSLTLTSGITGIDPIKAGSAASMVSGALEAFVMAAAIEMTNGLRINVVSPTVLEESMPIYESYFYGFDPVPAKTVALAYSKSVEGLQTGKTYRV